MYFVPHFGHAKVYETSIWTPCFQILAKTMVTSTTHSNILEEITFIPFWKNVIIALKVLWKSNMVIDKYIFCILSYSTIQVYSFQIVSEWNNQGIRTIWDILSPNRTVMIQYEIEEYYQIKIDFLEHGRFRRMVKEFLIGKEMPLYNHLNPKNSLNKSLFPSRDRKEVSNIQRGIHGRPKHILFNICKKGVEKFNIKLTRCIDVSKSLTKN